MRIWCDLDILLFWKKPWYSSIIPVMTHSRPPMAESIPSMINMKKKITDLRVLILLRESNFFDWLLMFGDHWIKLNFHLTRSII